MKNAHKIIALSLALILGAPMVGLMTAAPAAAGNWSGSTPDNGNGNSIAASGSSTDTVNPDGSITTCTESTTIFTSLKTGQVVQTIKRKRCITKKAKVVQKLISAEMVTTNNPDGTSNVVSHDVTNDGTTSQTVDTDQHFAQPDGQGNVLGGDSTRTDFDGKNTTKQHDTYDPATGQWVAVVDAPKHNRALLPILGAAALIFGLAAMHHGSDVPVQTDAPPAVEPNR